MTAGTPAETPGLDEIREVMADLPGPDLESGSAALTRQSALEREGGSLGALGDRVEWLAAWQGRHPPSLNRARTAVFAGNHGLASHAGKASQSAESIVQRAVEGTASVNGACTIADADLRVFEMALEAPTLDATMHPAMEEQECAQAIAYGMMAVEQGLDLLCLDCIGAGSEVSAAALSNALFGGSPTEWSAAAGPDGEELADLVGTLVGRHGGKGDPFEILRRVGGFEICAIVGAIIAARIARTPVVLGGYAATAGAGVLFAVDRRALEHCRAAQAPLPGSGLSRLTAELGLQPLSTFGSMLGVGTEATLAIPMLKAAVEIHAGMAPALR